MHDPLFDRVARALAGRYVLERELGHGGMGAVFLATDRKRDEVACQAAGRTLADGLRDAASIASVRAVNIGSGLAR